MAILVNAATKVICQGFTGSQGTFHSEQAIAYGTKMVGGVTPGKGGTRHLDLPVFNTVHEARAATGATPASSTSRRPSPPTRSSRRSTPESSSSSASPRASRLSTWCASSARLGGTKTRLIGPNCPGVITPGRMQDRHHAGPHPPPRQDRHRLALRHPDLRGGGADDRGRARPVDLRRHRRRPGQRHQLHRRARNVPGRRRDRGDRHDRRDRRAPPRRTARRF